MTVFLTFLLIYTLWHLLELLPDAKIYSLKKDIENTHKNSLFYLNLHSDFSIYARWVVSLEIYCGTVMWMGSIMLCI